MAFGCRWRAAFAALVLLGTAGTLAVVPPAVAQAPTSAASAGPASYYVEFRAADIGVYGHSYIVFGRLGPGGRPATVQYADFHPEGGTLGLAVGHAVPVAADMTPEKETLTLPITSSFRRAITAAQYKAILATIQRVHANNHVWSALAYNCNSFVGDVAEAIGMKSPTSLLFSTAYIPALRYLNDPTAQDPTLAGTAGRRQVARTATVAAAPATTAATTSAPKRAPRASARPAVTPASAPAASGPGPNQTTVY